MIKRRAASAIGHGVGWWVRRVARTSSLVVVDAVRGSEHDDGRSLPERLLCDVAEGRAIVPFWSAHQITLALLAADRFALLGDDRLGLRAPLERLEVVADDSFGGEMMHALGGHIEVPIRSIHKQGSAERLQDLHAWMRNPGSFTIAVDGGTTYGSVPSGIVRLAARLRATLWPLAIRARPATRIRGFVADIPLTGATVALAIGGPLPVTRAQPVATVAAALKQRLDDATQLAEAALAGDTSRLVPFPGAHVPGRRRADG